MPLMLTVTQLRVVGSTSGVGTLLVVQEVLIAR
jgi:hypothetical protein